LINLKIAPSFSARVPAKPTDLHLLSTVRAVEEGIIRYLERREARREQRAGRRANDHR
jgi:hypothetical protein